VIERSGQPDSTGLNISTEAYPHFSSWRELEEGLTQDQQISAEIDFSVKLMQVVHEQWADWEPFFAQELGSDFNKYRPRFIGRMLDFWEANVRGKKALNRFREQWGQEGELAESIMGLQDQRLDLIRSKIFSQATDWGDKDLERIQKEAARYARGLPRDEKKLLYERYGITSSNMLAELAEYGISAGANAASSWTLEGLAFLAGTSAASVNPLSHVDTRTAIGFLAASYGVWGVGVWKNFGANLKLLQEEGVSTSLTAKALYDVSKALHNKKIQAASAFAGFTFWQVVQEVPWYVAAYNSFINASTVAGLLGQGKSNSEISFLAGANVAAAAYNELQAKGTDLFLGKKEAMLDKAKQIAGKLKKQPKLGPKG